MGVRTVRRMVREKTEGKSRSRNRDKEDGEKEDGEFEKW
jgi:hypothetical protein